MWQLQSCGVMNQIPEQDTLLTQNKIEVVGIEKDLINDFFYKDDLFKIPIQQPNKKLLGVFPLSLNIWSFYNRKKVTRFSQFMKTKIGAQPVIFDSTQVKKSEIRFSNYYSNIGYFDNKIQTKVETRNRKTIVNYNIYPNKPYKYRTIIYDTASPLMRHVIQDKTNRLIEINDVFNVDLLIQERQRITNLINEAGYYTFNKEFIEFDLDTFKENNEIDLYVKIQKETDTNDFKRYLVDSIFVVVSKNETENEQLDVKRIQNVVFFQNKNEKLYNERFLYNFFELKKDSFYSRTNNIRTIQRLTDLNNFKIINSNFSFTANKPNSINALYSLIPYRKQFFSTGVSAYNSSLGLIGSNINFNYNNKNLTKSADRFSLSLTTGLEFNFTLRSDASTDRSIISRSDIALVSNYSIDKLMVPFYVNKNKLIVYRTNISGRYAFEKRLAFYDLHNLALNFGYEWSKNPKIRHFYNPFSISYIFLPQNSLKPEFIDILNRNPYLKASFSDALILGSNYQFVFINNSINKKHVFQFKFNAEMAGNMPFLTNELLNLNKDESIKFNNVPISQFAKMQTELIYAYKINKPTSIHTRFKFGYAKAFGNSSFLPYIKQFFLGGPYSLRAFRLRSVGPGSVNISGVDISDQTGDIFIETNAEYRFNIIKMFKGALFLDAGNVWIADNKFNAWPSEAIFKMDKFYKDFYIGGGAGMRFDFDYFAIRLDLGFPIRVPYGDEDKKWVIKDARPFNNDWIRENLVFNIAVGYPF